MVDNPPSQSVRQSWKQNDRQHQLYLVDLFKILLYLSENGISNGICSDLRVLDAQAVLSSM